MSTFLKINTLPLSVFTNAEYLTYLNSAVALLPPGKRGEGEEDRPVVEALDDDLLLYGSPALGMSAEFVQQIENDLRLLADVVNESRISQETEKAAMHEKNRDNLATYILTRIARAGTLPLEAERDAGKFLYKVVKPYIGIARLPVAQETAAIQGLLLDLRKQENAPSVTILGLDAYTAELEKENDAYIAVTSQRTQARASNKKESSETIRKRLDEKYDDFVLLAQAFSIAQPSEEATLFIKNLNQLIEETTTAYKQRGKAPRTKKEEGGSGKDDSRPDIA